MKLTCLIIHIALIGCNFANNTSGLINSDVDDDNSAATRVKRAGKINYVAIRSF